MENKDSWSNPELYRRMCVPHESAEAIEQAFESFRDGVRELREKFRITEVVVVMQTTFHNAEGGVSGASGSLNLGMDALHDVMLARALGQMLVKRNAVIEYLRAGIVE